MYGFRPEIRKTEYREGLREGTRLTSFANRCEISAVECWPRSECSLAHRMLVIRFLQNERASGKMNGGSFHYRLQYRRAFNRNFFCRDLFFLCNDMKNRV